MQHLWEAFESMVDRNHLFTNWVSRSPRHYVTLIFVGSWLGLWLGTICFRYRRPTVAEDLTLGMQMFVCIGGLLFFVAIPARWLLARLLKNKINAFLSKDICLWLYSVWLALWHSDYFDGLKSFTMRDYFIAGATTLAGTPVCFIFAMAIVLPVFSLWRWLNTPRRWD